MTGKLNRKTPYKTSKQIYLIDVGQTGRTNCNIKTLQKVEIMCRLGVSAILGTTPNRALEKLRKKAEMTIQSRTVLDSERIDTNYSKQIMSKYGRL